MIHRLPLSMLLVPTVALFSFQAWSSDLVYDYVDIGTLSGGESVAYGLNDQGQVVGWSTIENCIAASGAPCRRAYVWQDGVLTDLGVLPGDEESFARAINDSGLIVGTSEANIVFGSGTFHAVEWDANGIAPLTDLSVTSIAHDVNESGQVAGFYFDPGAGWDRAAVWDQGTLINIGATEPHQANRAQGLSNDGKLAGFAWNLFSPNDSVVYDAGWNQIGGFGQFQNSEASDVNDAGVVVGLQAFPSGNWHGAYWAAGAKGATDVGLLPGTQLGELYDVNEAGIAVGRCYADDGSGTSRAVLFDGTTLYDLNDFLPAGAPVTLYEAREINEAGDIAGTAVIGGQFRAFMLRALPEWKALGSGIAGNLGTPELRGFGSLEPSTGVELRVTNAAPSAPFYMVAGFTTVDAPLLGGVLIPTPDQVFNVMQTDAAGEATLAFDWPASIPPGSSTFWQAWVVDPTGPLGVTATAGVTAFAQ